MIVEIILGLSLLIVWAIWDNYFPSKNHPPGPFRFPLVGNGPALVDILKGKPSFVRFKELNAKYGPLCYLRAGPRTALLIDDFDTMKRLLNDELWIGRPFNDYFAERSWGLPLGIIFVHGDGWREMRRFSMRTLRDFGYGKADAMQVTMDEEIQQLLTTLDQVSSQSEPILNLKHLFDMPVLNILWAMVSNVRTAEDEEKLKRLIVLVSQMSKVVTMGGNILDFWPRLRFVFPEMTGYAFLKRGVEQLQVYFKEVLDNRRKLGVDNENKRDWIDSFIAEIDKHKELGTVPNHYTEEQFITTITDLFEAGSETSSNSLEFAIYFAMKNLRVQAKVQEEIDRVVGRGRLPNTGDRPKMPYTEATLLEVQRMANVLAMTVRLPTEDTTLDGYYIAKDTVGIFNIYSVHMNKEFWGDPYVFRPERFLTDDLKLIPEKTGRVIPFGAGKRVCLGEQMARTTLFNYFTALLQNYKFEPAAIMEDVMCWDKLRDPDRVMFQKHIDIGFTLSLKKCEAKLGKR